MHNPSTLLEYGTYAVILYFFFESNDMEIYVTLYTRSGYCPQHHVAICKDFFTPMLGPQLRYTMIESNKIVSNVEDMY